MKIFSMILVNQVQVLSSLISVDVIGMRNNLFIDCLNLNLQCHRSLSRGTKLLDNCIFFCRGVVDILGHDFWRGCELFI